MKKEDTELGLYAKYLFIGKWLMQESMYVWGRYMLAGDYYAILNYTNFGYNYRDVTKSWRKVSLCHWSF